MADPQPHWWPDQSGVHYPEEPASKNPRWTDARALQVLEAFREYGPSWKRVQDATGVSFVTLKKIWEKGLPPVPRACFHGLRPVKEILDEEKIAARAQLQREEEHEDVQPHNALVPISQQEKQDKLRAQYEAMRDDIVQARVLTGRAIRISKHNLLRVLPGLSSLVASTNAISDRLAKVLETAEITLGKSTASSISVGYASDLLTKIHAIQVQHLQALREIIDLERRELGEPLDIVRYQEESDAEELIRSIMQSVEAIKHVAQEDPEAPPVIDAEFSEAEEEEVEVLDLDGELDTAVSDDTSDIDGRELRSDRHANQDPPTPERGPAADS